MAPDEQQDIFAQAGITPEDFGEVAPEPVTEVEAAPEAAETPAEGAGQPRDASGRFAPKEAEAVADVAPVAPPVAPDLPDISAQFNDPAARAAFAAADPVLKAEITRRMGDMQAGIDRYRAEAEPLRRFNQMAQAGGTTLAAALENYTVLEQALQRNPLQGLDLVCRNMGLDLRQVAAHVMGQPFEKDEVVSGLRQQLQAAERELQGFRAEREQAVTKSVQDFAATHPRLDELSASIGWILKNGYMGITTLEGAYAEAERRSPVSAPSTGAAPAAPAAPPAEPRKPPANLSISGSPTSGSNPAARTPALTGRAATEWAMAQAGL